MANNTISLPDFESLDINPKTVAYSCLELDVAELIGSIRWDAASILGWRMRSSAYVAHEILMRMGGEFSPLELKMGNFARALRNDVPYEAGARWLGRLVRALDEDQKESGFYMVHMDTGRKGKYEDGTFYNLPTLYTSAEFPALFYHVQMTAIKYDLCNLDKKERRARQRSIIESWLMARGCVKIIREKKETSEREKSEKEKAAPTCKCECASCANCASKRGKANIERLRHQPNEEYEVWVEKMSEEYYKWLLDVGDFGEKFRIRVKRAMHELEAQTNRAGEMMVHSKTNGKLRLVGGQPK